MKTMLHRGISLLLCAMLLLQMVPAVSVHVHAEETLRFTLAPDGYTLTEGTTYLLVVPGENGTPYYAVAAASAAVDVQTIANYYTDDGAIEIPETETGSIAMTYGSVANVEGALGLTFGNGRLLYVTNGSLVATPPTASTVVPTVRWESSGGMGSLCFTTADGSPNYLSATVDAASGVTFMLQESIDNSVSLYMVCNHNREGRVTYYPRSGDCTTGGHLDYWICEDCQGMFLDADCTVPGTLDDVNYDGHILDENSAVYVDENYHTQTCTICKEAVQQEHQLRYSSDALYHFGLCTKCGAEVGRERHDFILDEEALEGIPPYCERSSSMTLVCADEDCTRTLDVNVPAVRHSWSQWYTVSEATEQEPGEQIRYCLVCSDGKDRRTIPAKNHEHQFPLTRVEEIPATCKTTGTKEHYICNAAGVTEATSGCGCMYLDADGTQQVTESDLLIPMLSHNMGEWVYLNEKTQPTETEPGSQQRSCTYECGYFEDRVIPALNHVHQPQKVEAKAAGCLAPGNIEYYLCDFEPQYDDSGAVVSEPCGLLFSDADCTKRLDPDEQIIPATGHSMSAWTESDGEHTRYCTNNCGYTETTSHVLSPYAENGGNADVCQQICLACSAAVESGKGHEVAYTPCADDENCHEGICSQCGSAVQAPHSNWTVDETTGAHICMDCGYERGAALHIWGEPKPVTSADCINDGVTRTTCIAAGCNGTRDWPVAAMGHDLTKWYTKTEATETQNGQMIRYCLRCDEEDTLVIPKLGHAHSLTYVEPSHANNTKGYYFCNDKTPDEASAGCGGKYLDAAGTQPVSDFDLRMDPNSHSWSNWYYPEDSERDPIPTETTSGYMIRNCSGCGATQELFLPATSHVHQLHKVEATVSTCSMPGNEEYYICAFTQYDDSGALVDSGCGAKFSDEIQTVRLDSNGPDYELIPTVAHSLTEWKNEGSYHSRECTECNYTHSSSHIYRDYADNGITDTLCQQICLACENVQPSQNANSGHTFRNYDDCEDGEHHQATCEACGRTVVSEHNWFWLDTQTGDHLCESCDAVRAANDHIWVETDEYTAPTCTEKGSQGYICAVEECTGAKTEEILPRHTNEDGDYICDLCGASVCVEHVPEIIPAVPATCTTTGLTEGSKCTNCGTVLVTPEEIPMNGHALEVIPAVPATCVSTGLTEGSRCTTCGVTLEEQTETPKIAHTLETIAAKAPTCTENGKTAGEWCTACGLVMVLSTELPATGHRWSEWYVSKEATHTQNGFMLRCCLEDCGAFDESPYPGRGHEHPQLKWVEEIPATCNQQGRKGYWYCMDVTTSSQEADEADFAQGCEAMFLDAEGTQLVTVEDLIIPATGEHQMGDWKASAGNNDDSEFIKEERSCTCGYIEYRSTPRETHVHNLIYLEASEPSCLVNGAKARYACTGCPCLFEDAEGQVRMKESDQVIPATGHDYGDWIATDSGHQRQCSLCEELQITEGHSESPAPGDITGETCSLMCMICRNQAVMDDHLYSEISACDDRWQHQQTCSRCAFALVEDHEFGSWQYGEFTHANTNETITGHFRSCDCGAMETSVEHIWDEGKELKPGFMTYTCMVEGCDGEKVDFLRCVHTCAQCGKCTAETTCPDKEPCDCAQPEPLKTTEPAFLNNNTEDPNQTYLGDILAKDEDADLDPDAKPGQEIPPAYIGFTVGIQEVPLSDEKTGELFSNPYIDYVEQALNGYSTRHLFDIHLLDENDEVAEASGDAQYLIRLCLDEETVLALQKGLIRLAHITEKGTDFYGVDKDCTPFYKLEGTQAWFWADQFSPFALVEPEAPYFGREALATLANKDALLYAYDQIVMGVEACLDKITIYPVWQAPSLTIAELQMVMDAYTRDHTENFWLGTKYSISYKKSSGLASAVKPQYTMTGDKLETAKAAFNAAVDEVIHGITPEMSEFDRQLLVHDRLAARVTYDGSLANAHDAYGALIDGKAVCQGYAEAFQYLLRRVGIQSFIVTGVGVNADGEIPHAWNLVRIDNKYYHTDLTWDDADDQPYHAYFNMDDHFIAEDHVIAITAYPMEECVELEANYFTMKQTDLNDSQAGNTGVVANKLSGAVNGASFLLTEKTSPLAFLNWFISQKNTIFKAANLINVKDITYTYIGREAMISFVAENGLPPHSCGNGKVVTGQKAICTTPGWKDYYACSCGKLFKEAACTNQITNLAAWKLGEGKTTAGHDYGSLQTAKEPIHTTGQLQDGVASHYRCADCQEYFTSALMPTTWNSLVVKVSHQFGDWVGDANGHHRVCACGLETDQKDHDYLDEYDVSCETCGYERSDIPSDIAVIKPDMDTAAGKITVKLVSKNPISGRVMVAVYDLNGRMLGISYVNETLNIDKTGKTFTILYDKTGAPKKVRAFVVGGGFAPAIVIDPIDLEP